MAFSMSEASSGGANCSVFIGEGGPDIWLLLFFFFCCFVGDRPCSSRSKRSSLRRSSQFSCSSSSCCWCCCWVVQGVGSSWTVFFFRGQQMH